VVYGASALTPYGRGRPAAGDRASGWRYSDGSGCATAVTVGPSCAPAINSARGGEGVADYPMSVSRDVA